MLFRSIASFDTKYAYNYWRPVTAIRAAESDGNPDTLPDSTWTPLIATPNHPSFASNHSAQSRAAAEALAAFFGTDQVRFAATWDGVERSFNKFTDAAKEAGKSRIYAGIHWSFDMAQGEQIGRKVGQYVADHFFLPLIGSRHASLLAATVAAPAISESLRADEVLHLPNESFARWQQAGVDSVALRGFDVRGADFGGMTLGKAINGVIWGDDDADDWRLTGRTRRTVRATLATGTGESSVDLLRSMSDRESLWIGGWTFDQGGKQP